MKDKVIISGYPILFNEPTVITDEINNQSFIEIIKPHAFDKTNLDDVVLYVHDEIDWPLARSRNNTLKLKVDEKGLYCEADIKHIPTELPKKYKLTYSFVIKEQEFKDLDKIVPMRIIKDIERVLDIGIHQPRVIYRGMFDPKEK